MNNKISNPPFMIRRGFLTLCALLAVATNCAHAHTVWIEPSGGQLVIRFAEPDGKFETSPGYLDNLTAPIAFNCVENKPIAVESSKKSENFLLVGMSPANTVCAETSFTVRAERKPNFYARWQSAGAGAATPLLTLDLVPTGKAGEARAYFRGKPLGGVKATLRAPDANETELTTDADGFLHFTADQPGQYLLSIAHHREPLAGFHLGIAYKETSHNCALSWRTTSK